MTSTDLITAAPWIGFVAALAAVCYRLHRSRRAVSRRGPADLEPARRNPQEASCPEKNSPTRGR